jgi:hypothetical protein
VPQEIVDLECSSPVCEAGIAVVGACGPLLDPVARLVAGPPWRLASARRTRRIDADR